MFFLMLLKYGHVQRMCWAVSIQFVFQFGSQCFITSVQIGSIHHNLDLLWSCGSLGCCDLIILWLILLVCCRGKR